VQDFRRLGETVSAGNHQISEAGIERSSVAGKRTNIAEYFEAL
jgi:methyl-accepting chemotaxis protein